MPAALRCPHKGTRADSDYPMRTDLRSRPCRNCWLNNLLSSFDVRTSRIILPISSCEILSALQKCPCFPLGISCYLVGYSGVLSLLRLRFAERFGPYLCLVKGRSMAGTYPCGSLGQTPAPSSVGDEPCWSVLRQRQTRFKPPVCVNFSLTDSVR